MIKSHRGFVAVILSYFVCSISFAQQINNAGEEWKHSQVGNVLSAHGQMIMPAGKGLKLADGDRVMNLALVQKERFLIVKTNSRLTIADAVTFKLVGHFDYPVKNETGSMNGLSVTNDDATFLVSGLQKNVYRYTLSHDGKPELISTIDVSNGKNVNPLGIATAGNTAIVALAVANQVCFIDLANNKVVKKIPVGVCPYDIKITKDRKYAFVSNFGGPHPKAGDRTEKSAGTEVAVDERSVAMRGSVSVIDLQSKNVIRNIVVGIHPEAMVLSPDGKLLYVVDESGDRISAIDTKTFKISHSISTKPSDYLPYGSLTSSLAFSNDGSILFAANAGNNSVALINPEKPGKGPYGFIAAGGFPGSVISSGNNIFIGNVKSVNAGIQKVAIPKTDSEIAEHTAAAKKSFHFIDIMRSLDKGKIGVAPKAIPDNVGEPSKIKHVVYIIRENKKFDQVLGDIGKGNCDSTLVEFGRNITPNTHQLASNYVLLDNYYCSGVNSSDGHQWAIQGITTPYHEKDFSNGHCAYDFGTDPLSYAASGFIWDHLLRKGISFRNFGETDLAEITKGKTWTDQYNSWKNNDSSALFKCVYSIETLKKYSDMRYPGWNMNIPDQVRADVFLKALQEYETAGYLPEFIIIYLPNDHTSGYSENSPTPRAYVADNDLATGRVVEALTKSPFWKDMAIFINEDDPQSGTDHVDGHRSFCMVVSPYAKKDTVISAFYNQSSVLHTICRIFGVKPMNQLVAMAPVMSGCFNETPDFTLYKTLIPSVAINEMNPPKDKLSKTAARLAPLTKKLDFSKPDRIDDDALLFSQYVWSTIYGDKPFPKHYFGAHGKGLKKLGLKLDPVEKDND